MLNSFVMLRQYWMLGATCFDPTETNVHLPTIKFDFKEEPTGKYPTRDTNHDGSFQYSTADDALLDELRKNTSLAKAEHLVGLMWKSSDRSRNMTEYLEAAYSDDAVDTFPQVSQ
jgi:hypothetical protein